MIIRPITTETALEGFAARARQVRIGGRDAQAPDQHLEDAARRTHRLRVEQGQTQAALLHGLEKVTQHVDDRARDQQNDRNGREPRQAVQRAIRDPLDLVPQPLAEAVRDRHRGGEAAEHEECPPVNQREQDGPLHELHAADREARQKLAPVDIRKARREPVAPLLHSLDGDPTGAVGDPDQKAEQGGGDSGPSRALHQLPSIVRLVPRGAHLLQPSLGLRDQCGEGLLGLGVDVAFGDREHQTVAEHELHAFDVTQGGRHDMDWIVDGRCRHLFEPLLGPLDARLRRGAGDAHAQCDHLAVEQAQCGRRVDRLIGRGTRRGADCRAGCIGGNGNRRHQREQGAERGNPVSGHAVIPSAAPRGPTSAFERHRKPTVMRSVPSCLSAPPAPDCAAASGRTRAAAIGPWTHSYSDGNKARARSTHSARPISNSGVLASAWLKRHALPSKRQATSPWASATPTGAQASHSFMPPACT